MYIVYSYASYSEMSFMIADWITIACMISALSNMINRYSLSITSLVVLIRFGHLGIASLTQKYKDTVWSIDLHATLLQVKKQYPLVYIICICLQSSILEKHLVRYKIPHMICYCCLSVFWLSSMNNASRDNKVLKELWMTTYHTWLFSVRFVKDGWSRYVKLRRSDASVSTDGELFRLLTTLCHFMLVVIHLIKPVAFEYLLHEHSLVVLVQLWWKARLVWWLMASCIL